MDDGIKRILCIAMVIVMLFACLPASNMAAKKSTKKFRLTATEKAHYTQAINWCNIFHKAHEKPAVSAPFSGFSYKTFNTMYVYHTKKKEVYLTFDCGNGGGCTKKILDILKKRKVKAIFFVTKYFLNESPKLAKRMKKEGHLVGNHTMSHPLMSRLTSDQVRKQLKGVEKLMKKKTGYKLDKFFRPPYGNFSIRVLNTARKMGYKTVLWSPAWVDYNSVQPSPSYVLGRFKAHHHKGMISIMHNSSSADTKALNSIITYIRKKGYRFCQFKTKKK